MEFYDVLFATSFLLLFSSSNAAKSNIFREYIGAESDSIKLSDVPIHSNVDFHFILAFAIDYTDEDHPVPTSGKFNKFWETKHLTPHKIASIKDKNSNVKFAVSLGGDTVGDDHHAFFQPKSRESWVKNAVSSLTHMIKKYHIDGIDIDYEHFKTGTDIFAECIGQLTWRLKESGTISFASIAPYDDDSVNGHYLELWRKYGHLIDYVNFQFYAYGDLSVSEFVSKFNEQAYNYMGGQLVAGFESGGAGGLRPDKFFEACNELKDLEKLGGIFIWCADESKANNFHYEKKFQDLLVA